MILQRTLREFLAERFAFSNHAVITVTGIGSPISLLAFFEYMLQVPANRIGATSMSLPQLKVIQEVITLLVFAPFAIFVMRQQLKLDHLWAALCLVGAVYFVFRK